MRVARYLGEITALMLVAILNGWLAWWMVEKNHVPAIVATVMIVCACVLSEGRRIKP